MQVQVHRQPCVILLPNKLWDKVPLNTLGIECFFLLFRYVAIYIATVYMYIDVVISKLGGPYLCGTVALLEFLRGSGSCKTASSVYSYIASQACFFHTQIARS